MKQSEKFICALLTILLGVMFIALKSEVVSIALTVVGGMLIVLGVLDLIGKDVPPAVVKIVLGALIICFGWLFAQVVLYIVAALLLIHGILDLYNRSKTAVKFSKWLQTACYYASPVLTIAVALLLFFSGLDWIFTLVGIFAIVDGAVMLIDAFGK